MYMIQGA